MKTLWKKTIAVFLLAAMTLGGAALAAAPTEPQEEDLMTAASISSTSAKLSKSGSSVKLTFTMTATTDTAYLGITKITIHDKTSSSNQTITVNKLYNATSCSGTINLTSYLTKGHTYYATVTFIARNSKDVGAGKFVDTNSVTY